MVELDFALTDFWGFLTIGFGMAAGVFYPMAAGILIYKGLRQA